MKTITEMKTAAEMAAEIALPGRCSADGADVATVEVADLSVEDLLDRLNAIEQAEAVW
ncbi:hypothetical protein [Candidatus Poriferisodalis sp.]|uniref:hypothetical protein n=1 Tax=Candidatus Poriferisodalis sp. TaxID=3101277 RepID=UPI003B02C405